MFGRHVEVKFVKNKKDGEIQTDAKREIDYISLADETIKKVVGGVVIIMAAHCTFAIITHLVVKATQK